VPYVLATDALVWLLVATAVGYAVYWLVDQLLGFRLSADEEIEGADLSIHKISATPEADMRKGG